MKVADIMTMPPRTCSPDDVLRTAAELMWDGDCGSVVVTDDDGRAVAMITDRDVCMAALRGEPLHTSQVRGVMSKNLLSCEPDTDVQTAATTMAEGQVRRLPVVDDAGRALGVVSLNDIALASERKAGTGKGGVNPTDVAETLAAISRHRPSPASSAA